MKRIGLALCLFALISCSQKLLTYGNVHAAQYVLINKKTMAFRTYDRKPEVDSNHYLATIKVIKMESSGRVFMDCITTEKSTIRLILKE